MLLIVAACNAQGQRTQLARTKIEFVFPVFEIWGHLLTLRSSSIYKIRMKLRSCEAITTIKLKVVEMFDVAENGRKCC